MVQTLHQLLGLHNSTNVPHEIYFRRSVILNNDPYIRITPKGLKKIAMPELGR